MGAGRSLCFFLLLVLLPEVLEACGKGTLRVLSTVLFCSILRAQSQGQVVCLAVLGAQLRGQAICLNCRLSH